MAKDMAMHIFAVSDSTLVMTVVACGPGGAQATDQHNFEGLWQNTFAYSFTTCVPASEMAATLAWIALRIIVLVSFKP